jgi:hypothetical protein
MPRLPILNHTHGGVSSGNLPGAGDLDNLPLSLPRTSAVFRGRTPWWKLPGHEVVIPNTNFQKCSVLYNIRECASGVKRTENTVGGLFDGTPDSLVGVLLQVVYEAEQGFLARCQVWGVRLVVIISLIYTELPAGMRQSSCLVRSPY